jgi:hypothetical protein
MDELLIDMVSSVTGEQGPLECLTCVNIHGLG